MNIEVQIAELEEKHQKLEAEIEEELTHPGSNSLHITELKREKLRVKDQMELLRFVPATRH
jgi:hypothetical protein